MALQQLTMQDVEGYIHHLNKTLHVDGWYNGRLKYVYGPPRGGSVVATMMSHRTPLHYMPHVPDADTRAQTLWVDDILDSGATLKAAVAQGWGGYATLLAKPHPSLFCLHAKRIEPGDDTWWVFPWETEVSEVTQAVNGTARTEFPMDPQAVVRQLISVIGDDPKRTGLAETPARVAKAYRELFGGYHTNVKDFFKVFPEGLTSMVAMCNIEFYSHCEHHMIPFYGRAHVAYIPSNDGKVIGASKLARILDHYARRLQVQERIGEDVVGALMDPDNGLDPRGAACIIEGRHMCMCARGVGKQHSTMMTSAIRGCFQDPTDGQGTPALNELYRLIDQAKG